MPIDNLYNEPTPEATPEKLQNIYEAPIVEDEKIDDKDNLYSEKVIVSDTKLGVADNVNFFIKVPVTLKKGESIDTTIITPPKSSNLGNLY